MNREILKYLSNYTGNVTEVNRLITSSFISLNQLNVNKNLLLKKLVINEKDNDFEHLKSFIQLFKISKNEFSFENLIELFEFVISPSDKIVNGAIYTPNNIRNYIVQQIIEKQNGIVHTGLYADISCGCGGFLYTLSKIIKKRTNQSYLDIFPRIYGLDITMYSVERSKILLTLLALNDGEDEIEYDFKLFCGNSLNFDWNSNCQAVSQNLGFNAIVGNPPYVCSRNMDSESLGLLNNWSVCNTGHPDLYIPFFQIGFENLTPDGILGYITVNSFFKSINGRGIREYFSNNNVKIAIIDFEGEQVFKGKSTYTCLCFIENNKLNGINYIRCSSKNINNIKTSDYYFLNYLNLDNWNGWNLIDSRETAKLIYNIENTGIPFSECFETRNGIATLKNSVYKFRPKSENDKYYFRKEKGEREVKIEKAICRPIINSNKIKNANSLVENLEQIIFPYLYENNIRIIIPENDLKSKYPFAYDYLKSQKIILAKRDKGNGDYEAWYAFGRAQSLDVKGYKLFFPHITDSPNFIISDDKDLLFYNGLAAFSDNLEELKILKAVLESNKFWFYIAQTSKYYVSEHRSISKNYIKKFGIPEFTDEDKTFILNNNSDDVNFFIESKYCN
jgi:hypothetical protein